jgi:hypothetical protein
MHLILYLYRFILYNISAHSTTATVARCESLEGQLDDSVTISSIVTPEAQVNISSSTARLIMAYNVMYNVSVMVTNLCGQNSVTVFTEVYHYPHSTSILMNAYVLLFVGHIQPGLSCKGETALSFITSSSIPY